MDHPLDRYALRPARLPQEWSAYHAIRRDAIFSALLPGQAYDEHDPDEFQHRHLPHVLVRDGEIIGTVRIDLVGETQVGLRLIAIRRDLQRQGHGRGGQAIVLARPHVPPHADAVEFHGNLRLLSLRPLSLRPRAMHRSEPRSRCRIVVMERAPSPCVRVQACSLATAAVPPFAEP